MSNTMQPGSAYLRSFSGQAGQIVRIKLNVFGGYLDPNLSLLSSDRELLAENDDGGGDLDARIYYVLHYDGSNIIATSGFSDSSGEYELSLVVEKLEE